MRVKVYDFDGTIYTGDSSVDFFLFTFKRYPLSIIRILPQLVLAFILYFCKKMPKKKLKETFFSFLQYIADVESHIEGFWKINYKKMEEWYLQVEDHSKDVIISASPEFLLQIPAQKIGINTLLASKVDTKTGEFLSENCYGSEKVKRLYEIYPECIVLECYSDSYSDRPILEIAQKAYIVNRGKCEKFS